MRGHQRISICKSNAFKRLQRKPPMINIAKAILPSLFMTIITSSVKMYNTARQRIGLIRCHFCMDDHINKIGYALFSRIYRVDIYQFRTLCSFVHPFLCRRKKREHCLAPTLKTDMMLCITLRILAGASYLDVGWPYGVARSTTYAIFHETLNALNENLPTLTFPIQPEDCAFRARQFRVLRNSPLQGIVAALDGIAIRIRKPKLTDAPDPRKYFNRKGFFAICVQAVVAADYKFVFLSVRHAGGTHDSTAFQATELHSMLEQHMLPNWVRIAADDAYAINDYILTPYNGFCLTQIQDSFNFYLSSCRIVVEQAFGMLVARFGILWSPLRFSLRTDTLILMVLCKLHNFIVDTGDLSYYNSLEIANENNVRGVPIVYLQNDLHTEQDSRRGLHRHRINLSNRDKIARSLNTLGFLRPHRR